MRIDFTTAEPALETGAGLDAGLGARSAQGASVSGAGNNVLPEDTAEFSGGSAAGDGAGEQAAKLTAQALAPDAERAGRVDALRSSVANGNYTLDPSAIAQAMAGEAQPD